MAQVSRSSRTIGCGLRRWGVALVLLFAMHIACAGAQREEALADSVRTLLRQSISAGVPSQRPFGNSAEYQAFRAWHTRVQPRLSRFVAQPHLQSQLLSIVDYEARRAGLDPDWVLAVIEVESRFNPRINIRYGCVILRHYLDQEQGDLVRALARYNGSLGQLDYPVKVLNALAQWRGGVQ